MALWQCCQNQICVVIELKCLIGGRWLRRFNEPDIVQYLSRACPIGGHYWCPIFKSSHCTLLEDQATVIVRVPDLQMVWTDLTSSRNTRILIKPMATGWHAELICQIHMEFFITGDLMGVRSYRSYLFLEFTPLTQINLSKVFGRYRNIVTEGIDKNRVSWMQK